MPRPLVLVVLGTRPEAIKLAPVIRALRKSGRLECRVCVTAQHRRMLDEALACFGIEPRYDLDLMTSGQTLNGFSSRALGRLGELLRETAPALVVVQGDTTTALVGALAAFHERIPVAHVEAGLRSFDRDNPYPEELNRVLIDELAELHFPPTAAAARHLPARARRGALVTGNTGIDALKWAAGRRRSAREPELRRALAEVGRGDQIALVTTHRRESFGGVLAGFCGVFQRLAQTHPRLHLFYPVHLNPKVQAAVRALVTHPRVHLLPTLDYLDETLLLRRCRFVLTDSGGIQEEAAALGKPVLVLRKVTERPEAIAAGVARLAGTDPRAVFALACRLVSDERLYRSMARPVDVFGDGRAAARIVRELERRVAARGRER